jgi:hypothetical protein
VEIIRRANGPSLRSLLNELHAISIPYQAWRYCLCCCLEEEEGRSPLWCCKVEFAGVGGWVDAVGRSERTSEAKVRKTPPRHNHSNLLLRKQPERSSTSTFSTEIEMKS